MPVGDDKHLVLSAIGRIVGLEPTTGKLLWEFDEIANNSTTTPMPLGNGRFLIGASEGRGETTVTPVTSNGVVQISQQVDGAYQARFLWRADKATSSFGSPIFAGGNAYFINRAGVVYCLDAENGEQHYAQRSAGSVWATPLHVGDRIYLFGRSGTTTVIRDGKKFEKLAENPLWGEQVPERKPASDGQSTTTGGFGGPVLYGVAVAGNKLLLRRGDRLYCVGANADFER